MESVTIPEFLLWREHYKERRDENTLDHYYLKRVCMELRMVYLAVMGEGGEVTTEEFEPKKVVERNMTNDKYMEKYGVDKEEFDRINRAANMRWGIVMSEQQRKKKNGNNP